MSPFGILATTLLLVLTCTPARAAGTDSALCQQATASAEHDTGVPDQLLGAISRVETGRYDRDAGGVRAWPWTINAQGIGHYYESKAAAVQAARDFQAAGVRSIDVGCMQINLMYHPEGFASLDQAFDPVGNAVYAARFLTDLFHQTGSWPHAAAAYHSQTPDLGIDYQRKVLEAWAEPVDRQSQTGRHHGRAAVAATVEHPAQDAQQPAAPLQLAGRTISAPFGERPLGGFEHVIREQTATATHASVLGGTGRTLAAYRAFPISLSSMPRRFPD
ncbi:MAG: lytic transglycosylase domain-containing protein [Janthinobacterium lividum]